MRIDGVTFLEGAINENLVIPHSTEYDRLYPKNPPQMGEIVFQVDGNNPGLYVYIGSDWVLGVRSDLETRILNIETLPSFTGDVHSTARTNVIRLNDIPDLLPGTYKSVVVDQKGRVRSGGNPTTLNEYGITDAINKSSLPTNYNNEKLVISTDSRLSDTRVPKSHTHEITDILNFNSSVNSLIDNALSYFTAGVSSVNGKKDDVVIDFADLNGVIPDSKLKTIPNLTPGIYTSVTVDNKGRVTYGENNGVLNNQIIDSKLELKLDANNYNKQYGYVKLDSNGKIDQNLITNVAISNTHVANTQQEVDAKIASALPGDIIVNNLTGKSLIKLENGSVVELNVPNDVVTSINGKKGNINKISLNDISGLIDSNNQLFANLMPNFTGDIKNTGSIFELNSITNLIPGTYNTITVNSKGQVTNASNTNYYSNSEIDLNISTKLDINNYDKVGGYPKIHENGKIDGKLIPVVQLTKTTTANTTEELTRKKELAVPGDVIIDNTTGKTLIKLSDGTFTELNTPTDTVKSINGKVGNISKILLNDISGLTENNKLIGNLLSDLTGDVSNIGSNIKLNSISVPGTYDSITINEKGLVTKGKTGTFYTKNESDILLGSKLSNTNFNKVGGYVKIQDDGKIDSNLLPKIALNDTLVANSNEELVAQKALAKEGDVIVDNTTGKSLIKLKDGTFTELNLPNNPVTSINGRSGNITKLNLNDISNLVDGNNLLYGSLLPSLSGDVTNIGSNITLKSIIQPGIFSQVEVNEKGLVVNGSFGISYTKNESNALLNSKLDISNFDKPNGYARVQSDGKIDSSLIPDISIGKTNVANTLAEMNALANSSLPGDVIINNVTGESFIKLDDGTLVPLNVPTNTVTSINGKKGNISKLALDDINGIVENGKLLNSLLPSFTGDVSNIGTNITLKPIVDLNPGTYQAVTVNEKGLVTRGINGVNYTKPEIDTLLTNKLSITNFDKPNGYAKISLDGVISENILPKIQITKTIGLFDGNNKLLSNLLPSFDGDVTSVNNTITLKTLDTIVPGIYTSVNVNGKGLVTGGTIGISYTKTETDTLIGTKLDIGNFDKPNGYVKLQSNGKIDSSLLPSLSISNTLVSTSDTLQTTINNAQLGDVIIDNTTGKKYIKTATGSVELNVPTDIVTSINGKTGDISKITLNDISGLTENNKLIGSLLPNLIGDVTNTGNNISLKPIVGLIPGLYQAVNVNDKGLVTSGVNGINYTKQEADLLLGTKLDINNYNKANGYLRLNESAKIDSSLIPNLSINNTLVANTAEELANKIASAHVGDVIIDNLTGQSLIKLEDGTAVPLNTSTDVVKSINGKTGNISKLSLNDISNLIDSNNQLFGTLLPNLEGDISNIGKNVFLKDIVQPGVYNSIEINAKGLVVKGTNNNYAKTEIDSIIGGKLDINNFDKPGGYVKVQDDGKLDTNIIPNIKINDTFVANSTTEYNQKVLAAKPGDVIINNLTGESFIKLNDGTVVPMNTSIDGVKSINGKNGNISKILLNDISGLIENNKLIGALLPDLTGDVTNIGKDIKLKSIHSVVNTYDSVTVNEKGLVIGGTNNGYNKTEIDALLSNKISVLDFNKPEGFVKLGSDGKIDSSLLANVSITNTSVANSTTEYNQKVLAAKPGDVIINNVTGESFIKLDDGTVVPLKTPTNSVTSINGRSGAINKIVLADIDGLLSNNKLVSSLLPDLAGDVTNTGSNIFLKPIVGLTPGIYTKVTVNNKGLVTGGSNPTTLSDFGITDGITQTQLTDQLSTKLDKTIGNTLVTGATKVNFDDSGRITSHSSLLAGDIPNLDASKINSGTLTKERLPALTGDVSSIVGTGNLILSNSGVTAGDYFKVNVDAKGRVTNGSNPTTLVGYGITDAINVDQKGVALGICPLDSDAKISATYLPSYVDDVIEAADLTAIQALSGLTGKIYVAMDNNKTYRWSGSAYIEVSPTIGTTNASLLIEGTLAKERLPALTGDVSSVIGTGNLILSNSGVTAGDYFKVTVDAKGRVTSGSNPTTLVGYGITDAQAKDDDLTAIAGLVGTSGLLKKTAANTWSLDTNIYLTGNQSINITGDVTGSGTTSIALTLGNSGVTAGTYTSVTVDAKGRVTSGSNAASSSAFTTNITTTGTVSDGFGNLRSIPASSNSTAFITTTDIGKYKTISSGVTLNASTGFAGGDSTMLHNSATSNVTITISGVTCYIGGNATAKTSLTFSPKGLMTFFCVSAGVYIASGDIA